MNMHTTELTKLEERYYEDIVSGLNSLVELSYKRAVEAQWDPGDGTGVNVGEKLALAHSEISEALEGLRKDLDDDHLPSFKMFVVEVADCFIRLAHLVGHVQAHRAGYEDIDLGEACKAKMEYNRVRPDHKLKDREAAGGKKF